MMPLGSSFGTFEGRVLVDVLVVDIMQSQKDSEIRKVKAGPNNL